MKKALNISIVLYKTEYSQVVQLIDMLRSYVDINKIYLIDNSPQKTEFSGDYRVDYIYNEGNIGFGAGHNIAIRRTIKDGEKYHLVINSDIAIDKPVINALIEKMDQNSNLGIIMPKIMNVDGSVQFLPKLLPTPLDLILRVIKPLKVIFPLKNKQYTLEEYSDRELNVPIISGCFSLFRVEALMNVGCYDENFFMYFEDFDISRRIHSSYDTIYFPSVAAIHRHERGASKNTKLFFTFLISAIRYFNKYGWFFDSERKKHNKTLLNSIS